VKVLVGSRMKAHARYVNPRSHAQIRRGGLGIIGLKAVRQRGAIEYLIRIEVKNRSACNVERFAQWADRGGDIHGPADRNGEVENRQDLVAQVRLVLQLIGYLVGVNLAVVIGIVQVRVYINIELPLGVQVGHIRIEAA